MTSTNGNNRPTSGAKILDSSDVHEVRTTLMGVLDDMLLHDGFGRFEVDMKILKRGQKEVLISCGKEYRFVVNFQNPETTNG